MSQEEAIEYVASTVAKLLAESRTGGPSRVFVVSTYVIGKERILIAIHRRCGIKIGVTPRKLGVMRCLDWGGERRGFSFIGAVLQIGGCG